jgi:signal transduction histidine kinase
MFAPISDTPRLTCPQCRAVLDAQDVVCPACGANIALVTLLAEQHLFGQTKTGPLRPTSVEQLVPRLGDYLLAQGHITEVQLQAALARKTEAGAGPRLIGQILVEMGAITREKLDWVIARQIVELQSALMEANRTLERRVTERTQELQSALEKLSEINQLKANIVANISHELRTPLTQVKGYAVLLADGTFGEVKPDQREPLASILTGVERLERLINDLIAYAATARGEMTLNIRPTAVEKLVDSVFQRSQPVAEKKGIRFSARCAPDLPLVMADEEKLRWVLMQLIDNAVKFTAEGGGVTLGVAPEGQRVRFAVQDTGIGIPANRLDEIFEEFRQLDGSASRRYGGTGLGLALVRRVVESHGSQVHVDSTPGRGSTFSFTLSQAPSKT